MKSIAEATKNEQMEDLTWASLVLMGAIGTSHADISVATNLVDEIAMRGEPQAQRLAITMKLSYHNVKGAWLLTENGLTAREPLNNHDQFNFLKLVS